jgi:hypothetical protein
MKSLVRVCSSYGQKTAFYTRNYAIITLLEIGLTIEKTENLKIMKKYT